MREYVDIVVVDTQFGKRVFEAPAWTHLKEGDRVTVDTRAGIVDGTVLGSNTVAGNSDEYEFIFIISDATRPLRRVISKVTERKLEYKEDSNE